MYGVHSELFKDEVKKIGLKTLVAEGSEIVNRGHAGRIVGVGVILGVVEMALVVDRIGVVDLIVMDVEDSLMVDAALVTEML